MAVVDPRNNGHGQYHGDPLPAAVLHGLELIGQHVRTTQGAGDVGGETVELQINFAEPGLFQSTQVAAVAGDNETVGIELYPAETGLPAQGDD